MSFKQRIYERIAKNLGILYRYHYVEKGAERKILLKKIWERELAPPKLNEWPQIKKDFLLLQNKVKSQVYMDFTVKEMLAYTVVFAEVLLWFFVGEMIGRGSMSGYIIPASYKDPRAVKFMESYVFDDPYNLKLK